MIAGPGYIVSYDVALYTAQRSREKGFRSIWLDDVQMMMMAFDMGADVRTACSC
jgi:hypothetical protein